MGSRPVGAAARPSLNPSPPNWKLAPAIAAEAQGLVVSGYGALPFGRALFLAIDTKGGAWLQALTEKVPVTSAGCESTPDQAAALAFTGTGLRQMGVSDDVLASFSRPFREGMFQEDRLRRLGDRRNGAWCDTVFDPKGDGPEWSAKTPLHALTGGPTGMRGFDVPYESVPEEEVPTKLGVHALLLLYTRTQQEAEDLEAAVKALLADHGVRVVRDLDLLLDVEKQGISREHFGFADGLSQPVPFGLNQPIDETACVLIEGQPAPRHKVQGVPLGEFLIGYQNGHSEPAPGPVVPFDDHYPADARLPAHPLAEGFADFGINGSYMVVRELKQDVAAFWQSLRANAERIRATDPGGADTDERWLAERIIGRGIDGHLLCPGPNAYLKPDTYGLPDNDFLFSERDPHGFGCPVGSHVRRAFPRDALSPLPTEDSRETLLQAANNHRILRRGRKFGPKATDHYAPDGEDRGLLFMCLNTDIERQFEFVQQTWLLNTSFATLFEETDPLLGPAGVQTLRGRPLRRKVSVSSYVQMAGGDYFFLPSMSALTYLALLP